MHRLVFVAVIAGGLVAACADTLPEQDLRIVDAVPVEKLSADILWREYQADAAAADAKYWGRAVEVTGQVTLADSDTVRAYVVFGQTDDHGVRANALDEAAADIVAAARVGERLTLKCFCAGLDGDVVLRSCVLPAPARAELEPGTRTPEPGTRTRTGTRTPEPRNRNPGTPEPRNLYYSQYSFAPLHRQRHHRP